MRRVFTPTKQKSCILALFQGKTTDIHQYCKFSIKMHSIEKGIRYLRDSTFLLMDVPQYNLTCGEKTEEIQGCDLCTLTLKANCSLNTGQHFIPPVMSSDPSSINTTVQHITNIALISQFFNNNTIESLSADLLQASAPQITLPEFKFYTHNISEKFAQDNKIKLDLSKAAKSIVDDGVIIQGLSEAVVLGEIAVDSNFWLSIPGFTLEGALGLNLILIINMFYLLFRVRQLAIIVMVLQANLIKANAQQPFVLNYYDKINQVTNETDAVLPMHSVFVTVTARVWPYLLACLVALAMVLNLTYKLWKTICKPKSLNMHFHVMLEFTANQRSTFIKILKLNGQASDYRAIATDYIRNITIEGFLRPKLRFCWDTIVFQDQSILTALRWSGEALVGWSAIDAQHLHRHSCVLMLYPMLN
jgi:hypothetical protein